ncbi:MAG: hypothetical protein R3E96_05510 [Planctomycetota bacterium]
MPIDETLVAKHSVLQPLLGQTFELPIGGSVSSPRIDIKGALGDLTKRALQEKARQEVEQRKDELQDKVRDKVEEKLGKELDGLLGGNGSGRIPRPCSSRRTSSMTRARRPKPRPCTSNCAKTTQPPSPIY